MPKLAAKARKGVEKAQAVSGGFELLKPGKYVAELSNVEAKKSAAGNPVWSAEFNEIHALDGERQPGRQWYNLNLPSDVMPEDYKPKSGNKSPEEAWESYQSLCNGRLKAFFEAFGFSIDSDTDEMIGERAVLQIGVRTIQNGPKKGEDTNTVNGVFPLDSVEYAESGSDGDSDEF